MDPSTTATAVISLLAAGVAVWSVIVAHRANGRADEANIASAEANRIAKESLEAQRQALPPAWSPAMETGKNTVSFQNQSGRHIVVDRVEVEPDEAADLVRLQTSLPTRIEYGDLYELMVLRTMQLSPDLVALTWHFEGEETQERTERRI